MKLYFSNTKSLKAIIKILSENYKKSIKTLYMKSGSNLIKISPNYKANSISNGKHLNKSLKIKTNVLKNYSP